jgi:CheY-like chemotaxis protein
MANLCALPYEHPTTIVLVDDDAVFLNNFSLALHRLGLMKTFTSTAEAMANINAQLAKLYDFIPTRVLPRINEPKRFDLFSVLVADYEIDSMSGLELCETISGSPIGRILLTGKVDERFAVRAFNDNVIDRYVRKDDPDMIDTIKKYTEELKHEFFLRTASLVNEPLPHEQARFLVDPVFCDDFERRRQENGIIEYYLSFSFPGYLMLDADGDVLVFAVLTERQLAEHVEAAENEDAPKELLDLLRAGLAIPFFPTKGGFYSAEFLDSWKNWTFTADMIEGKKRYYQSVVSGPAAHAALSNRPVFSYNDYLDATHSI